MRLITGSLKLLDNDNQVQHYLEGEMPLGVVRAVYAEGRWLRVIIESDGSLGVRIFRVYRPGDEVSGTYVGHCGNLYIYES